MLFIFLLLVFFFSSILVYLIDMNLNSVLESYIDVEVERIVNNIVNKKVNEAMDNINLEDYFLINNERDANIKISYDTFAITKIKNKITKMVQDELRKIDNGSIDEYFVPTRIRKGKFKKIKSGILCDVSIGSVRGSTLFANVSPPIPIKLLFSSQLNSDIDVKIKEYGINNAIIEIFFVIKIKEQITMPLTSRRKTIEIRQPLMIDIINGKVPEYYGGYIK